MTVQEIINALIGVPGSVGIEIVDADGIAAELIGIKITQSNGTIYAEAAIDRKLLADDETAVEAV